MYLVVGSRPEIIALVTFVTRDFCRTWFTEETLTSNVTRSPFQNFFGTGFHESLIPVVLVSGFFSKITGPEGTIYIKYNSIYSSQ